VHVKLLPELVPQPVWGRTLAKLLPKNKWSEIRKQELLRAKGKCEICCSPSRLACHEKWDYREEDGCHFQILAGFEILCSRCHALRHLGRSLAVIGKNEKALQKLVEHFKKVNEISDFPAAETLFWKSYGSALKIWEERSKFTWETIFPLELACFFAQKRPRT
jgi:hypothetical protein